MDAALEEEIRDLRARFRSSRDPEGRAFAPLADAYRRAGELDDAESLVDEGLDRLPDFAPGHLVAGRILRDRGDSPGAARAFDRVLELDPHNVEALREAAGVARREGRIRDALELYHRLAHLEVDDDEIRDRIRELKRSRYRAAPTPPEDAGRGEEADEEAVGEEEADEKEADEEEPVPMEATSGVAEPGVDAPEPAEPGEVGRRPAAGVGEDLPEGQGDEVYTRTMAELYARQGLEARAAEIYRRLLERSPEDADLRSRLAELEEGAAAPREDDAASPPAPAGSGSAAGENVSIAAYFRRLLRWPEDGPAAGPESGEEERTAGPEPGGGDGGEEDAPGVSTGEIVPIEALAPDAPEEEDDFRSWLRGMQR